TTAEQTEAASDTDGDHEGLAGSTRGVRPGWTNGTNVPAKRGPTTSITPSPPRRVWRVQDGLRRALVLAPERLDDGASQVRRSLIRQVAAQEWCDSGPRSPT